MKKEIFLFALLLLLARMNLYCQIDSLYLGQTPPGDIPVIFNVQTQPGYMPSDRIAITADGKEIYYSLVNMSNDNDKKLMKYTYRHEVWEGPEVVFTGAYHAPSLTPDEQTMFMDGYLESFYSTKTDTVWGNPVRDPDFYHYTQETDSGNVYAGHNGISIRSINESDTTFVSLGAPLNEGGGFYVAKDESYMILSIAKSNEPDLFISYKTGDRWTNPKSLGSDINQSGGTHDFGAYVDQDKYLFFTRYSPTTYDLHIYWVKIDELIDSLKNTNFEPYINSPISDMEDSVGNYFSYTIPENTFYDDNDEDLTITVNTYGSTELPAGLDFDPTTNTISGDLLESGKYLIEVNATDNEGVSITDRFYLAVETGVDINQIPVSELNIYPNPAKSVIYITNKEISISESTFEIISLTGEVIKNGILLKNSVDINEIEAGIYILRIETDNRLFISKLYVN